MGELACLRVVLEGKVQGVFFRAFVQEQALALGVTGFVRNLPDYRKLEIQAEGERDRLEALLERARVGPRGARVAKVTVDWLPFQGTFRGFEIRYA